MHYLVTYNPQFLNLTLFDKDHRPSMEIELMNVFHHKRTG